MIREEQARLQKEEDEKEVQIIERLAQNAV